MRRFIALGCVPLLAFLVTGTGAAETAADKAQAVINLENAWNFAEERHDGNPEVIAGRNICVHRL